MASLGLAVPAFAAAPTVSSFTPASGPLKTSVKITGSNFVAPVTVAFNGTVSSAVTVNSSTQVTASVPFAANTGPIKVTTAGGSATSAASFTVTPGLYATPAVGPPGTQVASSFSGFSPFEAVDVYFDSTAVRLIVASGTGSGSVKTTVAGSTSPGDHYITAVGRKSGVSAQSVFTVRTDWPQWSGNGGRTSENSNEAILGAGNVKKLTRTWGSNAPTDSNRYYQQAVVAGGLVYLASPSGIKALSLGTGATVWSRDLGQLSTPAVSGSTVVLGTASGHLMGLNAATGATKWDTNFGFDFNLPMAVANGTAYAGSVDYDSATTTLLFFDPATGTVKYGNSIASDCNAPTVSATALYITCDNGHLYAFSTANGSVIFDRDPSSLHFEGTPALSDGLLIGPAYVQGTGADKVVALDADTGATAWVVDSAIDFVPRALVTVADGTVIVRGYTSSNVPTISALSAATGTSLWSVGGSTFYSNAITAANGLLYSPDATFTDVLDLDTGRRLTQLKGGQFAVVTDAGVLTANGYGTTVSRYDLPSSQVSAARRPVASALRSNLALR